MLRYMLRNRVSKRGDLKEAMHGATTGRGAEMTVYLSRAEAHGEKAKERSPHDSLSVMNSGTPLRCEVDWKHFSITRET